MINSEIHSPLYHIAATPKMSPSRRSTYDTLDPLPSPSSANRNTSPNRGLSSIRGLRSPPSSPNNVQKLPNIHDQIAQWFGDIIEKRKLKAAIYTSLAQFPIFVLIVLALRFDLYAPIVYLQGLYYSLFSPWTFVLFPLNVLFCFLSTLTILTTLVKVDARRGVSSNLVTPVGMTLFMSLVNTQLLLRISGSLHLTGFPALLLHLTVAVSSVESLLSNDFRLSFGCNILQHGMKTLLSLVSTTGDTALIHSSRAASRCLVISILIASIAGPLFYGFSSLLWFFSPSLLITCYLAAFCHHFPIRAALWISNHYVMKPVEFCLPPAFTVQCPDPALTRNLLNVIENSDKTLKLFALFDVRSIAWSKENQRRLEIFSLSQPGGHPRNWTAVCNACLAVIDDVRTKVDQAAMEMLGSFGVNTESDDEDYLDMEMLLMPNKARKQIYSSAVRQRHRRAQRRPAVRQPPQTSLSKRIPILSQLQYRLTGKEENRGVISAYERHATILAVEGLYMLIVHSYTEDRYGMVLKDLSRVLSSLLLTLTTIDKYFRARAAVVVDGNDEESLRMIETAVQWGLSRVHSKFGPHLRAVGLPGDQLQLLNAICNAEV